MLTGTKPVFRKKKRMMDDLFDVIIIGGSYSGLSAAMALGRSLRKTLVIDSGDPCNRQTPHSHNFLTQDGKTPQQISAEGRQQVAQYPSVKFLNDLAVKGEKTDSGFAITTRSGNIYTSKKLIVASGIKDQMPGIPGFSACWGISVVHCPYCHGYEYRGQATGLLINGEKALHLTSLVRNLTPDLRIFTNGPASFDAKQLQKLQQHQIPVIETEIAEIIHTNGHLNQVVLKDGSCISLNVLYAHVPFVQHSGIPQSLGCAFTEHGHIQVEQYLQTTVPGVYACGDNSSPMRSVANAVYTGNVAGVMVNLELTNDQF